MGCGFRLLAVAEPAWYKGSSEQPLSPCAPGTASPAAGEGERGQPRVGPRHGQLSQPAGLPCPGIGSRGMGPDAAAHEQLFRQFLLAVSTGSHKVPPGCIFPWEYSPAGCAHDLTFTLPLLSLSPAPRSPAASSSSAFKPRWQPSCSPISECIQAAPCCILPIPACFPSVPAYPVSDTWGILAGSRAVPAGGGDRWGRRQSLFCSMAQFRATFDSLSGREAGEVTAALSGT